MWLKKRQEVEKGPARQGKEARGVQEVLTEQIKYAQRPRGERESLSPREATTTAEGLMTDERDEADRVNGRHIREGLARKRSWQNWGAAQAAGSLPWEHVGKADCCASPQIWR